MFSLDIAMNCNILHYTSDRFNNIKQRISLKNATLSRCFVPGGFPSHTYNPRVDLQLEQKLAEVKDNLCKLVTVTGQTKSGKTVLARKILPQNESIWIDGGAVASEDDFWDVIIEKLQLFQSSETEDGKETTIKMGSKGSAGANFLVAKGSGEVSGELDKTYGTTRKSSRTVSSRVSAIEGLRNSTIPLVIDDFHYISRDMQGSIIRALKPLIFDGLPVVYLTVVTMLLKLKRK